MKKMLWMVGAGATLIFAAGCQMCNDQQNFTCKEPTHTISSAVVPDNMFIAQPSVVKSLDTFRPIFEAGTEKLTVTGDGTSEEDAMQDAIKNFIVKSGCDYFVYTNKVVSKVTHPTWRFFATTTYTVRLTGIPIFFSKLEKLKPEEIAETPAPAPAPAAVEVKGLTKEEVEEIVQKYATKCECNQEKQSLPFGLLDLKDINVNITAKAETKDPAALTFPAPQK